MKIENKKTEEEVIEDEETSQDEDEAQVDDESEEDEASSSEESEDKSEEPQIDYKAELAKVQDRLKKAEFKLYQKSKKDKETHTEDEEDDDVSPTPTSKEEIQKMLEKEREEYRMTLAQDAIELELEQYADNPDRQALIKYHYENTINRSGYSRADIKHDLELAEYIADKAKFETRISEVKKSIEAQKSSQKGGNASGVQSQDKKKVNLSEKDKALLRRHGLSEQDVINNS